MYRKSKKQERHHSINRQKCKQNYKERGLPEDERNPKKKYSGGKL